MKNSKDKKNKLVGEGNSGTIYETKDNIAKKVFKNKKFFEAELSILEKIKGLKHVIRVKKVSKEENTIYMEFVPYNLDKILTGKYDKNLHQFNKKKIMVEILEGLKSLHNSGIIHNDFKTKNIQVTENSDIKIIDFDSSDFGLKSIPKRIEDINKAKIIILQILNKRSYNHVLKNKGKYLDEIKDDKNVMEFGRNNLSELINYVKKMN